MKIVLYINVPFYQQKGKYPEDIRSTRIVPNEIHKHFPNLNQTCSKIKFTTACSSKNRSLQQFCFEGDANCLQLKSLKYIHSLTFLDDYKRIINYITMNISWISAVLLLTMASCAAKVNYHQRRLYYNNQDFCCLGNEESDYINLVATFDDRPKITQLFRGQTSCWPYALTDVDRINTSDYMNYYKCFHDEDEHCDLILFSQKPTIHRIGLKVTSITQRATVKNPAKVDQKEYHCVIEGDGNMEHFGPFGSIPAPTIYLTCNHIKANLQTEESS